MGTVDDQDRFFIGKVDASTPRHLLTEGDIARLINARFIEGAITNAVGWDELPVTYNEGIDKKIFASNTTFQNILDKGDIQVVAPLKNTAGTFLVVVISGFLFLIDTETSVAYDITPLDAFLAQSSDEPPLAYLDNDGGVAGSGGFLVIFNYPNRPIFVNQDGARPSNPNNFEMPPARLGVTAGIRAFVATGLNIFAASDPLGGANSLAPLTFEETLSPAGAFYQQYFTVGSSLDYETITAMCRLPKFLGPNQEFLAQNVIIFTARHRYIIAAGAPRDTWDNIEFIVYAGATDGCAGPNACTVIGTNVAYISVTGRIKLIAQDARKETSLVENLFDEPLGQYLCHCESSFYYRDWYKNLDHSRSLIEFNDNKLYATVYPFKVPAIDRYGNKYLSPSHKALAIASIDSKTEIGSQATLAWEAFLDWMRPIGLVSFSNSLYVVSKDEGGRNRFYRENTKKYDTHKSTVYTRGYFTKSPGRGKNLNAGVLFFRKLSGPINVTISYLVNGNWECGVSCKVTSKAQKFSLKVNRKTDSWSIPVKIDIDHKGCVFELESISVDGEFRLDTGDTRPR